MTVFRLFLADCRFFPLFCPFYTIFSCCQRFKNKYNMLMKAVISEVIDECLFEIADDNRVMKNRKTKGKNMEPELLMKLLEGEHRITLIM